MQKTLLSLRLPALKEATILMPTLSVAEIVPMMPPRIMNGIPYWAYGMCTWRDMDVLVIDYQKFFSKDTFVRKKPNIAIKNGLNHHEAFSFFGVLIDGLPERIELAETDLINIESETIQNCEWQHFLYRNQKTWVAPEDHIEQQIAEYCKQSLVREQG